MFRVLAAHGFKYCRFYSLNNSYKDTVNYLKGLNLLFNHNFVNGKRTNGSDEVFKNRNPATGEVICEIHSASATDVTECIEFARKAQQIWAEFSSLHKMKVLCKGADLIRENSKTLASVDVIDTGKSYWEAEADISACADTIEMFGSFILSHEGSHVPLQNNNFYYTRREPLGVCVGIGAWNFPFQMITWKSAPALAAGNGIIFKPSPLTPLSAVLFAELFKQAGVPDGLVSVIQGGADVGTYLTSNDDVRKISFTGSVPTGRRVMKSSSDTLKHLTLELGGKSPLIIFDDTDINEAIKGIILANFLTQGQVCSNGTRVFIQSTIFELVKSKLIDAVKVLKVGDPFDPKVAIGAIISEDQFNIILDYVDSAKKENACILHGGYQLEFPSDSPLHKGKFIVPCIIGNCSDSMRVVKEEIFGPVALLLSFTSEDEVVQRANDSQFGLAGGVFTKDASRAHRIASNLQCGSVYVNTYNAYPPGIPFGGYKQSGFGRENCRQTLDYYSQIKSVYFQSESNYYPFLCTK